MKNDNEYERRCKAIQLHEEGIKFNKILRLVQRSGFWLYKWLRRYKEKGPDGLQDQSRAPKKIWRKTSERLVQKILSIPAELESHTSRRLAFAGKGAEVIQWELQQRKIGHIPPLSTIDRHPLSLWENE